MQADASDDSDADVEPVQATDDALNCSTEDGSVPSDESEDDFIPVRLCKNSSRLKLRCTQPAARGLHAAPSCPQNGWL